MSHLVVLERFCGQKTNDKTIKEQVNFIVSRALASNRGQGWECSISKKSEPVQSNLGWTFCYTLSFKKTSGRTSATEKQWEQIYAYIQKAGQAAKFHKYPWIVVDSPEIKSTVPAVVEKSEEKPIFKDYNTEHSDFFDHIYNREHQINIICSAIEALRDSDLENRFNCILYGEPGCAKTEILLSTGKMLGEEGKAFLKLDATSITEAGAQRLLLDSEFIPPVLIVEEIEKAEEKRVRWLLGILDQRGEIRKTNYRIGNRVRGVKMLCLATVNDISLFRSVMSGALASRFPHQIYCPRPDNVVLRKILERELKKVNGNPDWIDPTIEICNKLEVTDPRRAIPICLCGKDRLLDGSYQESIYATLDPAAQKRLEKHV